ncbi:MAG: competence/damage-inducible protein A [Rhodospirillales bacterium]|jgi:molybdenum cofactor synthesis domain-containing protein|nr:competence/damage-inducible protein A [Rhodospirillaceae bacterium]MDP6428666.1 competence/damage-inducible protein A [Rhodospirillales bacterium]MDP6644457.1 competence/damage-inducible protein A [Rhodospirillales bacterium]MDP6842210.1 competence/damage-inducible protein A [Rhodospirillales bacterium]|tara:strand:+ start:180 stop:989 length:810 start_codon:yes stop_codon:yes gene_type:complete
MTEVKNVTAAVLIIGNEVLSGRTRDANLNWMARRLTDMGIRLMEARVIPDVEEVIVAAINEARAKYDYVFTTGGIGPTHDDITAACVAKAFGVGIERHPEAVKLLQTYIPADRLNEARLKMADVPIGGELIQNPVSKAPGFRMENVFVMAGVPSIMRVMFDGLAPYLQGGTRVLSQAVASYLPEGTVAEGLGQIQERYPDADIGSYPFYRDGKFGCTLVTRTADEADLAAAAAEIRALITSLGGEPLDQDLVSPDAEDDEEDDFKTGDG